MFKRLCPNCRQEWHPIVECPKRNEERAKPDDPIYSDDWKVTRLAPKDPFDLFNDIPITERTWDQFEKDLNNIEDVDEPIIPEPALSTIKSIRF